MILVNPKYPHNVGATIRACSCFGLPRLFWTGTRMICRWPHAREERMKSYRGARPTGHAGDVWHGWEGK